MKPIHYVGIAAGLLVVLMLMNRNAATPYAGFGGLMGGQSYTTLPWYGQLGAGLGALTGGIAKSVWGDSSDAGYTYRYNQGLTL